MEYFTFILLYYLCVAAGLLLIFFLFQLISRKLCERMVDKTSGIIKNDLMKTPAVELSEEEHQKYPRNLIITSCFMFFVIIIVFLAVFYVKGSPYSMDDTLLLAILISLSFFLPFIGYALFLIKSKLYRVKAYCYKVSYGRQRSYYMVYYDFISYSIECSPLTPMPSVHGLTVEAGSIVDILVVAGNKRLRPIDFMKGR